MARASDVLAVAVKEIGTKEGANKRVKYSTAYGLSGYAWCMMFVWWCFQQVDKAIFYGGGKTASCGELMRWAQGQKKWVTKDFKPGDVLIYDFPGTKYTTDHCGICEEVKGSYVYAIEGNTSSTDNANGGCVQRKKRKLSLVLGAYRPDYDPSYRDVLQTRAALADGTMDYLAAYQYGDDLIRKLAEMK